MTHFFPKDFSQRLGRFKRQSGTPRAELARRLGINRHIMRRWNAGVRPNAQHMSALLGLADALRLSHLLTAQNGWLGERCKTPDSTGTTSVP